MVPKRGRAYASGMDIILPLNQAPPAAEAEPELTETEAAEIEERLRDLGYIE